MGGWEKEPSAMSRPAGTADGRRGALMCAVSGHPPEGQARAAVLSAHIEQGGGADSLQPPPHTARALPARGILPATGHLVFEVSLSVWTVGRLWSVLEPAIPNSELYLHYLYLCDMSFRQIMSGRNFLVVLAFRFPYLHEYVPRY